MNTAILVTTASRTGPGGTEVIARTQPRVRQALRPKSTPTGPATEPNAFDLRKGVERARHALMTVTRDEAEALEAVLEQAVAKRQQFWIDTCHEVWEMRSGSRQAVDLHARHGCRFVAASAHQVTYILKALDGALPTWDRDHPELFFQTLELNFPELVRCRKHQFSR